MPNLSSAFEICAGLTPRRAHDLVEMQFPARSGYLRPGPVCSGRDLNDCGEEDDPASTGRGVESLVDLRRAEGADAHRPGLQD